MTLFVVVVVVIFLLYNKTTLLDFKSNNRDVSEVQTSVLNIAELWIYLCTVLNFQN